MDVQLKPELVRFVDEQVKIGRFDSPEEVINAALAGFRTEQELTDQLPPDELDDLRAEIAIGIEQADRGKLLEWDADDVMAEVERRHDAEQQGKNR